MTPYEHIKKIIEDAKQAKEAYRNLSSDPFSSYELQEMFKSAKGKRAKDAPLVTGPSGQIIIDSKGNSLLDRKQMIDSLSGYGGIWTKGLAMQLADMTPSDRIKFIDENPGLGNIPNFPQDRSSRAQSEFLKKHKDVLGNKWDVLQYQYDPDLMWSDLEKYIPQLSDPRIKDKVKKDVSLYGGLARLTPEKLLDEVGMPLRERDSLHLTPEKIGEKKLEDERTEAAARYARSQGYGPTEARILPPSRGAIREDVNDQLHDLKRRLKTAGITSGQLARREATPYPELQREAEQFLSDNRLPISIEDLGADRAAPVFSSTFEPPKTTSGYPVAYSETFRPAPKAAAASPAFESSSRPSKGRAAAPENLPDVSDMDVQISHIPKYQQQAGKEALEMFRDIAHEPYIKYPGEKFAKPSAEQDLARTEVHKMVKDKPLSAHYSKARTILDDIAKQDLAKQFEDERQRGIEPVNEEDIRRHYDPYEKTVINNFKSEVLEDFANKVLEPLEGRLIASGQFYTGARRKALQRARNDLMKVAGREIGKLQSEGFKEAKRSALDEKKIGLEGMMRGVETAERDTQNKMEAATRIQRTAQDQNADELRNILTSSHLGGQEQAREQNEINQNIADFNTQQADKANKASQYMSAARGMPIPQTIVSSLPQIPQAPMVPNALSQTGGFGIGLGGMMMKGQQAAAHGGRIHRGHGGSLISDALKEIREQALQDSLMRSKELDKPGPNPWGDFLMHTGFGMAASRNPNTIGALAEGALGGAHAFEKGLQRNEARKDQAINLRNAIANSLRAEEALAHEQKRNEAEDLYKQAKIKHLNWEMEGGKDSARGTSNLLKFKDMINSGKGGDVSDALSLLPAKKLSVGEQRELFNANALAGIGPDIIENLKDALKYNEVAAPLLGPEMGQKDTSLSYLGSVSDTTRQQLEARQMLEKSKDNVLAAENEIAKKTSIPLTKIRQGGMFEKTKFAPVNSDVIKKKLNWWIKTTAKADIANKYGEYFGPITMQSKADDYVKKNYDPKTQSFRHTFEEFMGWHTPSREESTPRASASEDEPSLDEGQVDEKFPEMGVTPKISADKIKLLQEAIRKKRGYR